MIVVTLVFSVSFFIGRNSEQFISAINYWKSDDVKRQWLTIQFKDTLGDIWGDKIFYFSSSCGLIILCIILFFITEGCNKILAVLSISIILIIEAVSSFFYWYYLEKRFCDNVQLSSVSDLFSFTT